MKCDCDYGWSGDDCSIPPENHSTFCTFCHLTLKESSAVPIIAGVCAAGGALLVAVAGVTSAFVFYRRHHSRVRLEMLSDYSRLMFYPGTRFIVDCQTK